MIPPDATAGAAPAQQGESSGIVCQWALLPRRTGGLTYLHAAASISLHLLFWLAVARADPADVLRQAWRTSLNG